MALSYNPDLAIADPELQALLHDTWNSDYLVDPIDFLYSDNLLHDSTINGASFDNLNSVYDAVLPQQEFEFEPSHFPKRQRVSEYEEIYPSFFNPNPNLSRLQDYPFSPAEIVPPPQYLDFAAAGYSSGTCESMKKEVPPAAASVSVQSAAARERRRRITAKTHELGKLVPGGQKMNTAEMLQSAYKYIKFLQAQVSLLELVGESPFEGDEVLQILLESPLIQEKLYSSENCLIPYEFVEEFRHNDRVVESNLTSGYGKGSVISSMHAIANFLD